MVKSLSVKLAKMSNKMTLEKTVIITVYALAVVVIALDLLFWR
jgi:hypothetical protein